MKTLILLSLMVSMALHVQSQQSISVQAGGFAGYRLLSSDDNSIGKLIRDLRQTEQPAFRPSFTVSVHNQLDPTIHYSDGLQYAVYGYQTETMDSVRWGSQVNPDGTYNPNIDSGEDITEVRFGYRYNFIGVPISLRFSHREKKWRGYTQLGWTPLWYISATTIQDTNLETKKFRYKADNFNRFRLAAHLAFGIERQMANNFSFFLQPTLNAMVIPASNAIVSEWLYAGGLEVGIRKALKK
jgi:hypothetical protein